MPGLRIHQLLLPDIADAGQGRIDHGPTAHAIRVLRCEGVPDHVADVVRDQGDRVDLQMIEHLRQILSLGLLVVTGFRMR